MTCIKTGAKVHFLNYGCVVPADIFQVSNAVVIRTTGDPNELFKLPLESATHCLQAPPGGQQEFWREDLGVFVVPSQYLTRL